jgi:4-hydroxy-tetrahydrodipicolinate reductase
MESHQATKLDLSGTAKAVISCFQKLGVQFDLDEVTLQEKFTDQATQHACFLQ